MNTPWHKQWHDQGFFPWVKGTAKIYASTVPSRKISHKYNTTSSLPRRALWTALKDFHTNHFMASDCSPAICSNVSSFPPQLIVITGYKLILMLYYRCLQFTPVMGHKTHFRPPKPFLFTVCKQPWESLTGKYTHTVNNRTLWLVDEQ